jgi:two-component sensor histidine kinase
MQHPDDVLRELHHRVKNNFQIIASLLSLQKRLRPPERRGDFRFIEEHVQAMAIAHQVLYAAPELTLVPVNVLIAEVLDNLVHIAAAPAHVLETSLASFEYPMDVNHAIALCLYLAVVVPPYVDHALRGENGPARVTLEFHAPELVLTISGNWTDAVELDYLRARLADSYQRQLGGATAPSQAPARVIRFTPDRASENARR